MSGHSNPELDRIGVAKWKQVSAGKEYKSEVASLYGASPKMKILLGVIFCRSVTFSPLEERSEATGLKMIQQLFSIKMGCR